MRENLIKRAVGTAAAICVMAQPFTGVMPRHNTADAAVSYYNAKVANQGSGEGNAVIKGSDASVVYDSDLKSNVLDLHGSGFGRRTLRTGDAARPRNRRKRHGSR